MVLAVPITILPGVGMMVLDKLGLIPKTRALRTVVELSVVAGALWVALPLSVSLFPQRGEIESS